MSASKPGDLRLWRPGGTQFPHSWTIPFNQSGDTLEDAVYLADHIATNGCPPQQLAVQRLGEDSAWHDVPEIELAAAREADEP